MSNSGVDRVPTGRRRGLPNRSGWRTFLTELFAARRDGARRRRALGLDALEPRYALSNIPFAAASVITDTADGAHVALTADLDGDGDQDVVSISVFDSELSWFENDGAASPTFTAHLVSTSASSPRGLAIADLDGDGDLDLLTASRNDDKIAWFENDGAADPAFTERVISTSAGGAWSVQAADVDGDGDLDVLSASYGDDKIAWYENDGAADPAFSTHVVSTSAVGAFAVAAADLDGDGDLDLLSASFNDDTIAWYENDGAADPAFTKRVLTTAANGAADVGVADLDGDGDSDIFGASVFGDTIVWYENDGAADPAFTEHVVTNSANGAIRVAAADLDGDGDLDLLSASLYDGKVAWYENDGAGDPSFTSHVITGSAAIPRSVAAGDLDGDGDLDVLTATQGGPFPMAGEDTVAWYRNDGDYTAPTAQWTAIADTNAAVGGATITFGEAVQNVSLADFTLNGTALNTLAGVALVVNSTTSYSFTGLAAHTAGHGTHTLSIAGNNDIRDLAGNDFNQSPSEAWFRDAVAPTSVWTAIADSATAVNGATITFSEAVQNVSLADFALNGTALNTLAGVALIVNSPSSYAFTGLAAYAGAVGAHGLAIFPGNDIRDLAGNALDGTPSETWHKYLLVTGTEGRDLFRLQDAAGDVSVTQRINGRYVEVARLLASLPDDVQVVVESLGGDDVIEVRGSITRRVQLIGGQGNDRLTGGNRDDLLDGGEGKNTLKSGLGNDVVLAGSGDDRIENAGGNDTIDAGEGRNTVTADGGDNLIVTGAGNDRITTKGGRDVIRSGGGDDRIHSGGGDDIIVGGTGNDRIDGGEGRDLLIGGLGADRLDDDDQENLIVAGFTSFDFNDAALRALSDEWTSTRTYAQRVQNLSGDATGSTFGARQNQTFFLRGDDGPQQTVFDDGAIDDLDGGKALDWFLAELEGPSADKRSGLTTGEQATDLDA